MPQTLDSERARGHVNDCVPEALQWQHNRRSYIKPEYDVVGIDNCIDSIDGGRHPRNNECYKEQHCTFAVLESCFVGVDTTSRSMYSRHRGGSCVDNMSERSLLVNMRTLGSSFGSGHNDFLCLYYACGWVFVGGARGSILLH